MRKLIYAGAVSLALAATFGGGMIVDAQAASIEAAQTASPARFGLPDLGDLVEQVGPAVVNISIVKQQQAIRGGSPSADDPFYDFLRRFGVPSPNFPEQGGAQPSRGIGSGFIISKDGYVLTNAHVVGEQNDKTEVTVRLIDKREFKAKVIGVDMRTDVAVLKIDAKDLPVVRMGNPETARVGEWVIAVGSPFGFDNTVTAGIISAKARRLQDENYVPFIQTDVAVNPGNSGGPLFNLAGEVIGINSQIYSRSGGFMGISFAIPIDVALNVKEQLIEHGRVQRGKLGVMIQGIDSDLAQSFGLSDARGALVASVEPGSAADKAGLKAGDVVIGVDGNKVDESSDLPRIIGEKRPGTTVKLQLWRDGASKIVDVRLDEMNPGTTPGVAASGQDTGGKLGLRARTLSDSEASKLGVQGGLIVDSVSGPSERSGLRAGDVILALNNQPVSDIEQFRKLLERVGNRFALLVQRGNARIFVPVRLD